MCLPLLFFNMTMPLCAETRSIKKWFSVFGIGETSSAPTGIKFISDDSTPRSLCLEPVISARAESKIAEVWIVDEQQTFYITTTFP